MYQGWLDYHRGTPGTTVTPTCSASASTGPRAT